MTGLTELRAATRAEPGSFPERGPSLAEPWSCDRRRLGRRAGRRSRSRRRRGRSPRLRAAQHFDRAIEEAVRTDGLDTETLLDARDLVQVRGLNDDQAILGRSQNHALVPPGKASQPPRQFVADPVVVGSDPRTALWKWFIRRSDADPATKRHDRQLLFHVVGREGDPPMVEPSPEGRHERVGRLPQISGDQVPPNILFTKDDQRLGNPVWVGIGSRA